MSEHLILSAHEFIPLESLNHKKVMETSENQSIEIDFENALNCLKSSLKKARNNGKSTRLASMDNLMRENKKYNYIGIKKVRHPDDEGNFKSFKDFIIFAQNLGYVQLVTAGDFYEILLPDENPEQDSSFTVDIRINREHWIKICRDLKKFKKENLNKKTHFMKLEIIERITQFSSKENFNYSKSIITGSYDKLISVELLIPINDVDNEVKFTENKELNAEYYAKKLMKIA